MEHQDIHAKDPSSDGSTDIIYGHRASGVYSAMSTATAEELPSARSSARSSAGPPTEIPVLQPIPLICSICPKTTKFSDVSHLLTHIASKGHLSNMFKLDIAKYTDDQARERLQEYQVWFDEYNIRELLQSRSENRIQKDNGGRSRSGTQGSMSSVSLRGGHVSMVSRDSTRKSTINRGKRRVQGSSRLTIRTDSIKCEPEDEFDSISDFTPSHAHDQQSWHQNHEARPWSNPALWNGAYFESGLQQDLDFGNVQTIEANEIADNEDMETSSRYAPSDDVEGDDGSPDLLRSEDTIGTTIHETDAHALLDGLDDEECERLHFRKYLKGEIAKLEGVGGFDAAREEQRRKRNQKKDPSVLVRMEASSRAVRTFEQVTDLNFNHIRWRDVYDEPSVNGSDDEGDEPKPARKPKRRSPKKTRGKVGRPRGIKVEEKTRGKRRGRAKRNTRPAPTRPKGSKAFSTQSTFPASIPITRSSRSTQASLSSVSGFHPPGHIRFDEGMMDVFRDNVDPLPGSTCNGSILQRRQDGLPGLALRPGSTNHLLMSPTSMLKRHTSTHVFSGKENAQTLFHVPPTTSNPYLNNPDSVSAGPFNPLCMQSQETSEIEGFTSWEGENMKPINGRFQPANDEPGFHSLHLTHHHNEGYRSAQRQNEEAFGI